MRSKKAQESIGMSFGMIFSIFLIVVFIIAAFIAIKFFLGFQETTNVAQFYNDLQSEINKARGSSSMQSDFKINLPDKITDVCFYNATKEKTASIEITSQILSVDSDANIYLIPQKEAEDNFFNKLENIDLEIITNEENPYCVPANGVLRIIKQSYSKNIIIE
jgi:hypothetical protein